MVLRRRFDPDGVRAPFEQLPGFRIGDDRPACGNHYLFALPQKLYQNVVRQPLVIRLAVQREQLAEREIGLLFDQRIHFEKRHAQMFRKRFSDRGFAGAPQPNERNDRLRGFFRGLGRHQRDQGYIQGESNVRQPRDGDISLSGFEIGQIS